MDTTPNGSHETAAAPGKRSTHIRWDEETIAEHDKLRGTRQKIEEPPTPYHAPVELADSDSETSRRGSGAGTPNTKKGGPGYLAEHWETLTSALEAAASNQSRNTSLRLRAGSMDDSGSSQASTTHGGGSGASSEPSSANTTHRRTSFSNRAVEATEADSKPRTPVEQKKFADKRLNHYDEYKRLQEWRAKRASMSDDDDDDDEDEDDTPKKGPAGGGKA